MFVQTIETKQNVGHVSEVSKNNGFKAFRGASNPLSNFYQFKFRPSPCEILNTGKMFSSIEQAYAYGKANFHDDKKRCQLILQAKTARDAQTVANEITTSRDWKKTKVAFMESLLQQKLVQCGEFKASLRKARNTLVEATGHPFWASGLSWKETLKCETNKWPDSNQLGKLLGELKHSMQNRDDTKEVILIGDSNTSSFDDRFHATKHTAYSLSEAAHLCDTIEKDKVVVFHVGINDIEQTVQRTIFMDSEDKKNITDDISQKMCDIIDSALQKQPHRVIWSKCFPHHDTSVNDILNSINIKVHNHFLENVKVIMSENSSVAFKGKLPNKKLYRDKKHLNEAGVKIFVSNLLHILNDIC